MYLFIIFYFANSIISNYILSIRSYYSALINCIFLILAFYISKKFRIHGITGQIASGKSTSSNYLREKYGATVIDIDKLNAEVLQEKEVKKQILQKFGEEVFDEFGNLKKLEVRKIIFNDNKKKKQLENITHFKVLKKLFCSIFKEKFLKQKNLVMIENAILLKIPFLKYICYSIIAVVSIDKAVKIRRIMERDNIQDRNLAENILHNQMTIEEFNNEADYVILNDGRVEELHSKIDLFIEALEK
jgi:dephospho-CoA kinase